MIYIDIDLAVVVWILRLVVKVLNCPVVKSVGFFDVPEVFGC